MEKLLIVKLGGKVLADESKLNAALSSFADSSLRKILIHGGGNEASDLAEKMNVPVKMIEGRRITDDSMLEIVTMVYGGLINKKIVAQLQSLKINAIGMSGADGNIILSERRPVKTIDYGNVGDIKKINSGNLVKLLENDFVPTICALTHDGKGQLLNTNADTIAAAIAETLSECYDVELCYCFEFRGVLENVADKNSVIPEIDNKEFEKMKISGSINDGMIPKIFNALEASKKGVQKVYICSYESLDHPSKGTQICFK